MTQESTAWEAEFARWLEENRSVFWKVARAFAPTAADQADLVQEMQLQLWRALPGFRHGSRPSTFIYRICLNVALMWRRSRGRRATDRHDELQEEEAPAHPGPDPGASAARRDLVDQLYAAIRRLPEGERSLILLQLDGLSYEEIARITGMTVNHIGVALTRARKNLITLTQRFAHELA